MGGHTLTRFLLVDAMMFRFYKRPGMSHNSAFQKILESHTMDLLGTAISPAKPISVFMSGNSAENPLRVQVSTSLTTIKPASDAELTSFWNSLHGMKPENGFLKFDPRSGLLPETLKWLYIRKAYEDMFQIICNNLNSDNDIKKRFHRMAITGTPGIGKSMFLFYILWRLANEETTKTVILHRQLDRKRIYVFQNDGCWKTENTGDINAFLDDSTTWYLMDALKSPTGPVNAVTILVSSPSKMYYSAFLKYIPVPFLHYLPLWSLEELKKTADSYSMNHEEIENRFKMIGGIARYVLEDKRALGPIIDDAIGSLALNKLISIALGETSKENEISHRIVHFKVEPPHYSECRLEIGSDYVFEEALRRFLTCPDDTVKEFIIMSENSTSLAYFRRLIFEKYAHRKLSEGGEFLVRSLDDESESMMEFPLRKVEKFRRISACKELNVYYKMANKNNPCIDSVVLNEGYFRMTTSLIHPIKKPEMKSIVEVLRMDKLYFVVPGTSFREFEKQRFEEDEEDKKDENVVAQEKSTGKKGRRKKRSHDGVDESDKENRRSVTKNKSSRVIGDDFIQQYVINIPMDPRLDLSALRKGLEISPSEETTKVSAPKQATKVSSPKQATKVLPLKETAIISLSEETAKLSVSKEKTKISTLGARMKVSS